jgi:hypothetical protein
MSPEVEAACVKVAGDWAIRITTWTLERSSGKTKQPKGRELLQKHFQRSYQFLIQTAGK